MSDNQHQTAHNTVAQPEQLHATVKANFNNKVDVIPTKFHFRKVKDEKTGIETKRPTVEIPLPVPSFEGICIILEQGGAGLDLLRDAVTGIITEVAREWISNNEQASEANFPYEMLSWEAIANLPKAERKGGGISKEVWEEFAKDYITIMPAVTGKPLEAVELAAKVFLNKFASCKTNKPVLEVLKSYLALYINSTTRGEEFAECVSFLDSKVKTLIETDTTNLLLAL